METTKQTTTKAATMPDLVWAALILAGVTIFLFLWFALSPGILVGMDRPKDDFELYAAKPSPFTPVVDESVQPRRQAAKAVPVIAATDTVETAEGTQVSSDSAAVPAYYTPEHDTPAKQGTLRGEEVYEKLERESDMPRMSAALIPAAGEESESLAR